MKVGIQPRVNLLEFQLLSPQANLLPVLLEEPSKDKWIEVKKRISSLSWRSNKLKEKALQHFQWAKEMAELNLKEPATHHFREILNYILQDFLERKGIRVQEFWDDFRTYEVRTLRNTDQALYHMVYFRLYETREILPWLKFLVLKKKVTPDPILIVRLKHGRKWFKILEW